MVAVKENFQREIEKKEQEISAVRDVFRKEMEKKKTIRRKSLRKR